MRKSSRRRTHRAQTRRVSKFTSLLQHLSHSSALHDGVSGGRDKFSGDRHFFPRSKSRRFNHTPWSPNVVGSADDTKACSYFRNSARVPSVCCISVAIYLDSLLAGVAFLTSSYSEFFFVQRRASSLSVRCVPRFLCWRRAIFVLGFGFPSLSGLQTRILPICRMIHQC